MDNKLEEMSRNCLNNKAINEPHRTKSAKRHVHQAKTLISPRIHLMRLRNVGMRVQGNVATGIGLQHFFKKTTLTDDQTWQMPTLINITEVRVTPK